MKLLCYREGGGAILDEKEIIMFENAPRKLLVRGKTLPQAHFLPTT